MQTNKTTLVHKAGGETEEFSDRKLQKFLRRIEVPENEVQSIVDSLMSHVGQEISTREITERVTERLRAIPKGELYAARYNIKNSIRLFGPDGHNFEEYVGRIFAASGYDVRVGQPISGKCVEHELDVLAIKDGEHHLVECKFHNKEGTRSDLTVALYSHARFADIHGAHEQDGHKDVGWLATNTKLTSEALKYVRCAKLRLLNFDNPNDFNIMQKVTREGFLPVSCIDVLEPYLKEIYAQGIILLREFVEHSYKLSNANIPDEIMLIGTKLAVEILEYDKM